MDPALRRWWRLLDDLPQRLGRVERWLLTAHAACGGTAGCAGAGAKGSGSRGSTGAAPPLRSADWPRPPSSLRQLMPLSLPAVADGEVHACPTSIVCLEGVVRVTAPDRRIDLHAGEALIVGAGVRHEHAPLRRGSLWFGQGFMPACSDVVFADAARDWHGRLPSQPSRRLMDAALADADAERRRARFRDLLAQVLSETVEDLRFANPALRRMIALLWSSLQRGITVDDLVAASGLGRAQAYAVFTAGYGIPPKAALAQARLGLAGGMLAGGLPIARIAAACGYPSADTFTRAWKRVHGAPPRAARSRGRGG